MEEILRYGAMAQRFWLHWFERRHRTYRVGTLNLGGTGAPHTDLFSFFHLVGGGVGQYRRDIMEPPSEGTIGPTVAQAENRRERFVRWRRVQAMGGFTLACCFFLPAVDSCNSPVIPAKEVVSELQHGSNSLSDLCMVFLWFVAAYLFGLLVAILGLRRVHTSRVEPQVVGTAIAILCGFVVLAVFTIMLMLLFENPEEALRSIGYGMFVVPVLFSLVYLQRAVRLGVDGFLHLRWYMALCCTVWFTFFLLGKTYYGLWLSIVGSVVILVGSTGEAAVRTRTTWLPAIRLLVTSRAKLYDDDLPRCEQCGYILIGLTEKRCPECGLAFEVKGRDSSAPNGAAGCSQG